MRFIPGLPVFNSFLDSLQEEVTNQVRRNRQRLSSTDNSAVDQPNRVDRHLQDDHHLPLVPSTILVFFFRLFYLSIALHISSIGNPILETFLKIKYPKSSTIFLTFKLSI